MNTSLMLKLCAAMVLAGAFSPSLAQMHKCIDAAGKATYSDRACPVSAAASAIKAPPIAAPTRRDALAAQFRRIEDNHQVAMSDLDRRLSEARQAPGPASLGGSATHGLSPSPPSQPDSAKCAGIRHQQRRAKISDPLGHDRSIHAHELQKAAKRHCSD